MNQVLQLKDVRKHYGKILALDSVSLSVEEGEFVALLGLNGSGKSTMFHLLTGLFVADSGTICIIDYDLRTAPIDALRHIGVVYQQQTLDLDLSVEGNLRFFCALQGLPNKIASERIERGLEWMDLTARRSDKMRELSGGNRRKVELVRSMLHRPRMLLMDEPTVGLDPASRHLLLTRVLQMCHEQKLTVLWATHLVDEAEQADRVVVLHHGRCLADGTPDELVTTYAADSLSAAFLAMTK